MTKYKTWRELSQRFTRVDHLWFICFILNIRFPQKRDDSQAFYLDYIKIF